MTTTIVYTADPETVLLAVMEYLNNQGIAIQPIDCATSWMDDNGFVHVQVEVPDEGSRGQPAPWSPAPNQRRSS